MSDTGKVLGHGGFSWAEWHDLGIHAASTGNLDLAHRLYGMALIASDNDPVQSLGTNAAVAVALLGERKNLEWCIDMLSYRAETRPGDINNWITLATAYVKVPDPNKAIGAAMKGFEIDRHNADVLQTLATCYGMLGMKKEEIQFAWLAADVDPSRRWQHAMVNMKVSSDFAAFAKNYAGRKKPLNPEIIKPINLAKPGTVLVCMEQGLGDLIMMGGIMRRLSNLGFELYLFATEKTCIDIGAMMWPFLRVVDQPTKAGSYDYVVNLMDLLEFKTNNDVTWITRDGSKDGLGKETFLDGKIGVNFTGNPKYEYEYCRGIYDDRIRKLVMEAPGAVDLADYRDGSMLDFRDRLSRLKAVITTDTMTAHLAGAMGIPCLVLLAKNHDWRWYHKWYGRHLKTATQSVIGDWDSVLPDVDKFVKEIA